MLKPALHIKNCSMTPSDCQGVVTYIHHCQECPCGAEPVNQVEWSHNILSMSGTIDMICADHGIENTYPKNRTHLAKKTNNAWEAPIWH
jgi:hypothetical protein